MVNELQVVESHPPLQVQFTITNVAQAGPIDGVLAGGLAAGQVVPAGYAFHPLMLQVRGNDSITAGVATFKVTKDGTELTNGPEVTLTDADDDGEGFAGIGADPIDAGEVIGVSGDGDGSLAPETIDYDAFVYGVLTPA